MQMGKDDEGLVYDALFNPDGFVMAARFAFPGKGCVSCWTPKNEKSFYESNSIPNGRSLSLHPDCRRTALLISQSANANGRQLIDGVHQGNPLLSFQEPGRKLR